VCVCVCIYIYIYLFIYIYKTYEHHVIMGHDAVDFGNYAKKNISNKPAASTSREEAEAAGICDT